MTQFNGQNYCCLYCGNPNPRLIPQAERQNSFSLIPKFLSINRGRSVTIIGPVSVKCPFCNREFLFIADVNNPNFIADILNKLNYTDEIIVPLKKYDITIQKIHNNFIGIAIPIQPKEIKGEIHIIFRMEEVKFCLSCCKFKHPQVPTIKYLARRLEEI